MYALLVIGWIMLGVTVLTLATWVMVLVRVRRVAKTMPTLRAGLELPFDAASAPKVSIVIPAHNEEAVIEDCLRSVRAQDYPNLEIIIVMDRCTDSTADIVARHAAEDDRITPIVNTSCPEDWTGKCNAVHQGALRSTGEWILFADADTTFDPRLLRAAFAQAQHRKLNMLSLLTTLTFQHQFEFVAQPVAGMWLLRMFPIDMVNRADKPRPFANGQFILVERSMYEKSTGFAGVRDQVVEDIAFARLVNEHGGRGGILLAEGMLRSSMYESFEQFKLGWKRIFIGACKNKPSRLRKYGWRALLAGVFVPLAWIIAIVLGIALTVGGEWPLGVLLIGMVLAAYGVHLLALSDAYQLGGAPRRSALYYPLGSWHTGRILITAANDLMARKPVVWGGKQYVLEPR